MNTSVDATAAALRSLEAVTDPALSPLPVDELLDALTSRTKEVTSSDIAAVLLTDPNGAVLRVRAINGDTELAPGGGEVPLGEPGSTPASTPASTPGTTSARRTVAIGNMSESDLQAISRAQPRLRSIMVAPVLVGSETIGIVEIGASRQNAFEPLAAHLLQVVADRCAGSIERARLSDLARRSRLGADHAQLHLELLGRGSTALNRALDSYDIALEELGNVVVPDFADWFAADLPGPSGELRRMAEHRASSEPVTERSEGAVLHSNPNSDHLVQLAISEGRPQVVLRAERFGRSMSASHLHRVEDIGQMPTPTESMLVVPVRVRDLVLGALSFATAPGRRAYRPSDLETAKELAERVSVAVERVFSYRAIHEAGEAAQRHADHLQKLVDAALVVNAQSGEAEVVEFLAEHVLRVLDAERVAISAYPSGGPFLEQVWPAVGEPNIHVSEDDEIASTVAAAIDSLQLSDLVSQHLRQPRQSMSRTPTDTGRSRHATLHSGGRLGNWIAAPMTDASGESVRVIVALGAADREFEADDESVLTLLAQIASIAVENARLYADGRAKEHRLEAVVQSSPLAIVEFDLSGAARWWNRAAGELLGWGDDEEPRRVRVRERSEPVLAELWDRARGGEITMGASLSAIGPGGTELELSVSASPVNDTGTLTGMLLVAEDVTERRRMVDQVQQAERLSAMTRMAGAVAHDFNNLLTVILGCSDILLRQVEGNDALTQDVSAIQRAGIRAAELTGQLVRIGHHRPVQPEVVVVDELLGSMTQMFSGVLGEQIGLDLRCDSGPARVLVDRADLERSVLNLAINARDAMPDGGTFTVRAVQADVRRPGDPPAVEISFTDTGIGMDPDTVAHCFEPFFTTKGRARGTGLGLATVHAMVTQAGGQIWVDTEPGKGTRFTLRLPEHRQESSPARDRPDAAGNAAGNAAGKIEAPVVRKEVGTRTRVVVVVDDEPEVLRFTLRQLELRAFEVVGAADSSGALAAIGDRDGTIDLLITDVVMPGTNGVELAEAVKRHYPRIPVLFMSGHLDDQGGARCQPPRGAALLAKPFTSDELADRVFEMLERAQEPPTA